MGRPADQIIGSPIGEVWKAWRSVTDPDVDKETRSVITLGQGTERHDYEVKVSDLEDRSQPRGYVLVIHDITERLPGPVAH
jgi:hypothetical protein